MLLQIYFCFNINIFTNALNCAKVSRKGGKIKMGIRYYKLLDILNKRSISKGELQRLAGFSSATMAKLTKGDIVTTEIVEKICVALDVQPGDIMEHIDGE